MNLKQRITADFMSAFKAKQTEKKNFLGLIKSTIDNEEKSNKGYQGEITDESILKIIAKFEKNTNELIKVSTGEGLANANAELEILKSYLPTKLTDAEIEAEIKLAIDNGANNIGGVMAWFKDKQADRKVVSTIAVQLLK